MNHDLNMSHITPWEATLEIAEEGLGLKPGIDFQQVAKLGGHTSWNGSSRVLQVPGVNDSLSRRSACRYSRADLASIPTFNGA